MFSVPHLIILFVVVLVVFGPEKLPELARTLGKVMGEFRRATGELRGTLEDHLRDIEREADIRRGGSTISPLNDNTIGAPKPALGAAEGTVPSSSPHGWTMAPGANPPVQNDSGASAGPAAADTDTVATPVPDAPVREQETPTLAPERETEMPDRRRASAKPEDGHKGSDGGSGPA
jgi:sec-independent protein translocase protein TatB